MAPVNSYYMKNILSSNLKLVAIGLITVLAISIVVLLKGSNGSINQGTSVVSGINIPIETVGVSADGDADQVGTSWSGEIVSNGDVEVQPQREGTIVEWRVKIGQKVSRGQVLARLSAPPTTPELINTLAEQAQNVARTKAVVEAQTLFVEKNKKQLIELRAQIVNSAEQISDSLSNKSDSDRSRSLVTLANSLDSAQRDVMVKTQAVKDYSVQSVRKIFPEFTNYTNDPITSYQLYGNVSFNLRNGLGNIKQSTQTDFTQNIIAAVRASVDNDEQIGEKVLKLLQSADTLIANSHVLEDSAVGLTSLRALISDERANLSEKIKDMTEANTETARVASDLAAKRTEFSLTVANSNKETAEKLKDIDEKLIDLDRQLRIARGESDASGAAYYTISNALTGGASIIAPRSGIVSVINKKTGDFVSPGTAIASINSGNEKDRIVRFRIPGNIAPPQRGEVLMVIRPGFPRDGKKIKVVGTGSSLDVSGSFLADADFIESVSWPVHASVRVLPSAGSNNNALVPVSSVWWNDNGHPTVWLVTEENRIRPQEVKTGRTIGDKIEILEGLTNGNRIVSRTAEDLKTGMKLDQIPTTGKDSSGDMQGMSGMKKDESEPHSHDE